MITIIMIDICYVLTNTLWLYEMILAYQYIHICGIRLIQEKIIDTNKLYRNDEGSLNTPWLYSRIGLNSEK